MTVTDLYDRGGGVRIALVKHQFGQLYQSQPMTLEYNDLLVSFCLLQLIRQVDLLWRPPVGVHPHVAWENLGQSSMLSDKVY